MPISVYIPTEPYTPTGESVYAQPAPPDNELLARPPEPQGALSRGINRLLGTQFGEERYQTWPEKMVRSAATLAGDVVSGAVPVLPPGSRREDFTDEPAPGVPDNAPWWKMAPVAAQPNDVMMERAQDLAGVAMGGGIGGTGKAAAAGEAVLGSGPVRKMRYDALPDDMQTLLFDFMGEKHVRDLPVSTIKVADIPDMKMPTRERGPAHAMEMDLNETPPVVTAHGEFLDGRHRTYAARQRGVEELPVIDLSAHMTPEMARKESMGKVLRSGMGDEGVGPVPVNQKGPAWYSAVEHALESSTTGSAPGAQWLATLRNSRGVKPEEMAWLGLDDYLAAAQVEGRKVTRAELQDYVKSHQVELRDVEKSNRRDYDTMDQTEQGVQRQRLADFLDITPAEFAREYPTPRDVRDGVNAMLRDFGDEGAANATKYQDYQLPGGENYREHLITMPDKRAAGPKTFAQWAEQQGMKDGPEARTAYSRWMEQNRDVVSGDNYKSSHWEEPNILAHVRTNDRVVDGKKSLHLEEVQSDWHQQGRDRGYKKPESESTVVHARQREAAEKLENYYNSLPDRHRPSLDEIVGEMRRVRDGKEPIFVDANKADFKPIWQEYREAANAVAAHSNGVPDAPFKKTWHELALKRMLRRAAEEGYERLSWTPGDAQAARYDLSKQVDNLRVFHAKDPGTYYFEAKKGNRDLGLDKGQSYTAEELKNVIGKDMTKKALDDLEAGKEVNYSGLDLKIGGEGMRGFYDQILPKALEKIGREHGVKVQRGDLGDGQKLTARRFGKTFEVVNEKGEIVHGAGTHPTFESAEKFIKERSAPIFYIDIPQSLRDAAMRKGFPLFSGGKMFVPHQEEDK